MVENIVLSKAGLISKLYSIAQGQTINEADIEVINKLASDELERLLASPAAIDLTSDNQQILELRNNISELTAVVISLQDTIESLVSSLRG